MVIVQDHKLMLYLQQDLVDVLKHLSVLQGLMLRTQVKVIHYLQLLQTQLLQMIS